MQDELKNKIDADAIKLMESAKLPSKSMDAFKALPTKDKCLGIAIFAFAIHDIRIYNMYSNYYNSLLETEQ